MFRGLRVEAKVVLYGLPFLGLWSATFYLGTFVGPTLAGVLVDNFGFKLTTMIYSTLFVGTLGLNLVEIIYHKISKRRHRESP